MIDREEAFSEDYYHVLHDLRDIFDDEEVIAAHNRLIEISSYMPQDYAASFSILDVGCGSGLITALIQKLYKNAAVYALDSSLDYIEFAKDIHDPKIKFITYTLDGPLPFSKGQFDYVIATNLVHHIAQSEQASLLQRLIGITAPEGKCIITELNPWNIKTLYTLYSDPYEKYAVSVSPWRLRTILKNEAAIFWKGPFLKAEYCMAFQPYR